MKAILPFLSAIAGLATAVVPSLKNPSIWFDFDGTIAITEAFENLPETAYLTLPPGSTVPAWSTFSRVYLAEYDAAIAGLPSPSAIDEELHLQSLPALRAAEKASFDRVLASGLFSTVDEGALVAAAANVTLRPGFWEFVAAAERRDVPVSVLSRNWSVRWIREVLRASDPGRLAERLYIYCPEVLPEGVLRASPRDRAVDVFSGDDKRDVMRGVVGGGGKEILFVGDSNSDLGPILEAPTVVGVVAGLDSESAETIDGERQLWRAGKGWRGVTGERGVYVLESFEELVTLLRWK